MFNRLGTMRIADRKFKVIDATLTGRIGHESPVEWFLEVMTKEARYEGETRAPRAYLERCPSNACSMGQFLASPIVIESGAEFCEHRILLANFDLRDFQYVEPAGEQVGFVAPLPGKW